MRLYGILLAAALGTSIPANAQFKGIIDAAKKQLDQSAKKANGQGAPTPPAKVSTKDSAKDSTKDSKGDGEGLWPNLAVDEDIVKQQQEEVRKDCQLRAQTNPTIDCDCIVKGYPDFRLRALSRYIRAAEKFKKLGCESDPAKCSTVSLSFEWLTSRETQINFPTAKNRPVGPAKDVYPAVTTPRQLRDLISSNRMYETAQCVNSEVAGKQAETACMDMARSGILSNLLQPGQSTAEFCSCVKDGVIAGKSQSDAMTECTKRE